MVTRRQNAYGSAARDRVVKSRLERILSGLNQEQRRVVETLRGPIVIIAGPGTGKTLTIARRIAYQMATGKPPFHAGSLPELMGAMLMTAPADLAGIRADIPPDAAAVIMRCLKADPAQRFATAAEVFEAWQRATAG